MQVFHAYPSQTFCPHTPLRYPQQQLETGQVTRFTKGVAAVSASSKAKNDAPDCPCCKTGTILTIEIFGKRGPPKLNLSVTKFVPVK